jgi:hypothetical protein
MLMDLSVGGSRLMKYLHSLVDCNADGAMLRWFFRDIDWEMISFVLQKKNFPKKNMDECHSTSECIRPEVNTTRRIVEKGLYRKALIPLGKCTLHLFSFTLFVIST